MIFRNLSIVPALIQMENNQFILDNGETREIPVSGNVKFIIKHNYGSTTLPLNRIKRNCSNNTLAEVFMTIDEPPSFEITLDDYYEISDVNADSLIEIHRECLRPCYPCKYDRLNITVSNCRIKRYICSFREKDDFIQLYSKALKQGNLLRKILLISMGILGVLTLGSVLLFAMTQHIFALIAMFSLFFSLVVSLIMFAISAIGSTIEIKIAIRDFDSIQIIKYFEDDKKSKKSSIEID